MQPLGLSNSEVVDVPGWAARGSLVAICLLTAAGSMVPAQREPPSVVLLFALFPFLPPLFFPVCSLGTRDIRVQAG